MNKKSNPKIKAIIGLGNPLSEYENTYHNTGIIFVNFLANGLKFKKVSKKKFEYLDIRNELNNSWFSKNLILIKPSVYMNNSGEAVTEVIKYFQLKSSEIAIAHDDSDLTLGKYKISFNQSSAGHKGVQSIINNLQTQKFWRIKIGIRPEKEKIRQKAEKLVLKNIPLKEKKILESVFQKIISKN